VPRSNGRFDRRLRVRLFSIPFASNDWNSAGEFCLISRAWKPIALLSSVQLVGLIVVAGCQPTARLERAGLAVDPPATWHPVASPTRQVPGVALAAWAGPENSSLVIYRELPAPGCTPAMIAEALANRMKNLPELRLVVTRTETVSGTNAARVEVVAPGTGNALAPSGIGTPKAPDGTTLIPTRQVTIGFVRPSDTIYFSWNSPETSYSRIAPEIEATLGTIRFSATGMWLMGSR
jgi:hypothetical protein